MNIRMVSQRLGMIFGFATMFLMFFYWMGKAVIAFAPQVQPASSFEYFSLGLKVCVNTTITTAIISAIVGFIIFIFTWTVLFLLSLLDPKRNEKEA